MRTVVVLLVGMWTLLPNRAFAICGNEYLEHGEVCDDGNALDGDGCSALCQVEPDAVCVAENVAWAFPESTPDGSDGSLAPGWEVSVVSASTGYVPVYETSEGGSCAAHLSGSGWVSPNPIGGCAGDVIQAGPHWFRTRFQVTEAQLDAGSIALTFGHDNSLQDVWLNGVSLGVSLGTDRYLPDGILTLLPNQLVAGQNELVFQVLEAQGNNPINYSGVSVRQHVRFSCVVRNSPPETFLTGVPASPSLRRTPTFEFSASEPSTFLCRLDGQDFLPCASPFTTPTLVLGEHVFEVRAIDARASQDDTPATHRFVVGCTTGRDPEANCEDNDACTQDSCVNYACVHAMAPAGTLCGTDMACDASGACSGCINDGQCNDGNACTRDRCQSGQCLRTFAQGTCELAEGRTGSCQEVAPFACLECTRDRDCASGYCALGRGVCVACLDASHCADQNPCTHDVCWANTCQNSVAERSACTTALDTQGSCRLDARCVECYLDSECDGNMRCYDGTCVARAGIEPDADPDRDGLKNLDECPRLTACPDTDGDGQRDFEDSDDDNDDLASALEQRDAEAYGPDADLDGRNNWRDNDADNDGLLDGVDGHGLSTRGIPAYLDPAARQPQGSFAGGGGCEVGSAPARPTLLRLCLALLLAWLLERRLRRKPAHRRWSVRAVTRTSRTSS